MKRNRKRERNYRPLQVFPPNPRPSARTRERRARGKIEKRMLRARRRERAEAVRTEFVTPFWIW